MTGDELERAIQFLLESQGKNDAQIGQLGVRVDQIGVRVDQLTRDVAQLTASVARLTGDVARLTGDFADLKVLVKEFAESTRLFAQRAGPAGAKRRAGREAPPTAGQSAG